MINTEVNFLRVLRKIKTDVQRLVEKWDKVRIRNLSVCFSIVLLNPVFVICVDRILSKRHSSGS